LSHAFNLDIGGLRFAVEGPAGCGIQHFNPLYIPFLDRDSSDADLMINVSLSIQEEPEHDGLPLLFDTGKTWKAYNDEGSILLRLPNPAPPHYLWTFRLARDFSEATVYCSSLIIEAGANNRPEIVNPVHYPLDQLLAMFLFSKHGGLIIHAAGVAKGNSGVCCAGPSGAGKTTLMRQWLGVSELRGLSDDRVVIRKQGKNFRLFGTPWAGEGKIAGSEGVELKALTFIRHSQKNRLEPISPAKAFQHLLPVTSLLYFQKDVLEGALATIGEVIESIPAFELHCRPDASAAELIKQLPF